MYVYAVHTVVLSSDLICLLTEGQQFRFRFRRGNACALGPQTRAIGISLYMCNHVHHVDVFDCASSYIL